MGPPPVVERNAVFLVFWGAKWLGAPRVRGAGAPCEMCQKHSNYAILFHARGPTSSRGRGPQNQPLCMHVKVPPGLFPQSLAALTFPALPGWSLACPMTTPLPWPLS